MSLFSWQYRLRLTKVEPFNVRQKDPLGILWIQSVDFKLQQRPVVHWKRRKTTVWSYIQSRHVYVCLKAKDHNDPTLACGKGLCLAGAVTSRVMDVFQSK